MSETRNVRVKPSKDRQAEEMVADPEAYFAKVRRQAREEAELYVARRAMHLLSPRKRKVRGSFYLRMQFAEGREFIISGTPPITRAEFDQLLAALGELRNGLSHDDEPAP